MDKPVKGVDKLFSKKLIPQKPPLISRIINAIIHKLYVIILRIAGLGIITEKSKNRVLNNNNKYKINLTNYYY